MSMLPMIRVAAIATAIGVASLALPARADAPITVTYQDNNPWAQEVGSVTRMNHAIDYTVAVAANKTLQINLITPNPNIFFKVTDNGHGKPLIDTYNTGTKTWSAPNASATSYTIQVYIQPDAIGRDETAKYALQVGQYGASDMRPETTKVTFEAGKPWVQTVGTLDAQVTGRDYDVAIAAGESVAVNLIAHEPAVQFKVMDSASRTVLVDSATSHMANWSMPVTTAADFIVTVYTDPAAVPPGQRLGYALQIGHYVQQAAAPAPAGSAATPPASPPASSPPAASSSQR